MELQGYDIRAIEAGLDRRLILDCMLGNEFLLHHNLYSSSTSLIVRSDPIAHPSTYGIGISLEKQTIPDVSGEYACAAIAIFRQEKDRADVPTYYPDNVYRIFRGLRMGFFSLFSVPSASEITSITNDIEERMSRIEVRASYSDAYSREHSSSRSTESYYQSFEKETLSKALDNMVDVQSAGNLAYKVTYIVEQAACNEGLMDFLRSSSILLGTKKINANSIDGLMAGARNMGSMPLSYSNASLAFAVSDRIRRAPRPRMTNGNQGGDMAIGSELDGASDGRGALRMYRRAMNLGTMVSGLPGTGKTKSAMLLLEQTISAGTGIAVISPTGEWNGFAAKNSLKVIKLGRRSPGINFFKCESSNRRRFYENLSMLIACGCRAGPYTNSMEKCIVSALSKIYSSSDNPDPQEVYEGIEESIIEQHGKRGKSSVKYTKHGENIRSGLESLRQLLMNAQFAYPEGISFREIVSGGVVFDLSDLSNNTKPLVYSLLLNQVYAICDDLDLQGNNAIRLIICLEEAQLVFNKDDEQSATRDLQERIQNFRKCGVALVVICHSITDISPGIRRLCQNKLYFRQSADVAKFAANDLIFGESDYEEVIETMKTLDQRVCALSAVAIEGDERRISGSTFMRVMQYHDAQPAPDVWTKEKPSSTAIVFHGPEQYASRPYEVYYLREKVAYGNTIMPQTVIEGLLDGKKYCFAMPSEKKGGKLAFDIIAGTVNHVTAGAASDDCAASSARH